MVLTEYLAQRYLSASTHSASDPSDTRPTKKRKKNKHSTEGTSSLLIADDDDLFLSSKNDNTPEDDADTPLYYDTKVRSAEFRKSKKNAWKSLDPATNNEASTPAEDEADTLIRQTIATQSQTQADLDADSAPTIVDTPTPKMSSGARPGLQTAADTARLIAAEESHAQSSSQSKPSKSRRRSQSPPHPHEETNYRDAPGRRIDLSLRRAEARAARAAAEAAAKRARDDAMGEVQLRARDQRKQDLESAKFLPLARSADDDEYNDRLKEVVRWDDPMAAYIASRPHASTSNPGSKTVGQDNAAAAATNRVRKREYAGPSPPNRYSIKAGWRWDGVDRGNGFENEWFQARGKKARSERMEYAWLMDE